MRVTDRLATGLANVYPEVEAVGPVLIIEVLAQLGRHAQDRAALLWRECQEVGLVTTRKDENVAWVERRGVVERDAATVLG